MKYLKLYIVFVAVLFLLYAFTSSGTRSWMPSPDGYSSASMQKFKEESKFEQLLRFILTACLALILFPCLTLSRNLFHYFGWGSYGYNEYSTALGVLLTAGLIVALIYWKDRSKR